MGRPVDRSIAKMIAYKRLITGTLAMIAGCVTTWVGITTQQAMTPQLFLALAIFFGGGAWALRDGIRLRRELAR
ncbi:MAG TPA: hypothetical protein VIF62_30145 [Labilithrix sp.]